MRKATTGVRYEIGTSVTSVEVLLDTRTNADRVVPEVTRTLVQTVGLRGEVEVVRAVPGPLDADGLIPFVLDAGTMPVGLLWLAPEAVVLLADLVAGGLGQAASREPTQLETELLLLRLLKPATFLLGAVAPDSPPPTGLEHRPRPNWGRTLGLELSITHRDTAVKAIFEAPSTHLDSSGRPDEGPTIEARCQDMPVEVAFRFDPIDLPADEVAHLRPGDILRLDQAPDAPVTGEVGGRPLMVGSIGRTRRRAAVRIDTLVEGTSHGR